MTRGESSKMFNVYTGRKVCKRVVLRRSEKYWMAQIFSSRTAIPWPPPMQVEPTAYRALFRLKDPSKAIPV